MQKAFDKCPQKRLTLVGKPSARHLEETKDMVMPELVEADFRTTADDMEWWG